MIFNMKKGCLEEEIFPGKSAIEFLYGNHWFGQFLCKIVANVPLFSKLYGLWQEGGFTKKNILPFIEKYQIDASEFLEKPENFISFQDFFVRRLKPTARPVAYRELPSPILPADARYRFYQHVEEAKEAQIKGVKLYLNRLLVDAHLAKKYRTGSMIVARLSPMDCHRFLFPCAGIAGEPKNISGSLYSVNPIALSKNPWIFAKNERVMTLVETETLGDVLILEIGATNVGSIEQNFKPHTFVQKGEEKGLFRFGGSAMVLLFEKNAIQIREEFLEWTAKGIEVKAHMGESIV